MMTVGTLTWLSVDGIQMYPPEGLPVTHKDIRAGDKLLSAGKKLSNGRALSGTKRQWKVLAVGHIKGYVDLECKILHVTEHVIFAQFDRYEFTWYTGEM